MLSSLSFSLAQAQVGALKLNLLGLATKNITGSFEYILSENQSIVLEATYKIPSEFGGLVTNNVDELTSSDVSGFAFRPEYRIYASENDLPQGFYFGPLLNYNRADIDVTGVFEGYDTAGEIKGTAVGAGIKIGTQWVLGDRVTLDWHILSLSLNRYKATATFIPDTEVVDLGAVRENISQKLSEVPVVGGILENRFNKEVVIDDAENSIAMDAASFFVGVRSGFSVGIVF